MRVHHLNCGTMCPASARLVNGRGGLFERGRMVCHCLLIETDGLVLVDTGLGTGDIERPTERLTKRFLRLTRPRLEWGETALAQIEQLGFRREDVRHVVVTHLDQDHAGGLSDFPDAMVHIFEAEHAAALSPPTPRERGRYRAAQLAHGPRWNVHALAGDRWFGFERVDVLGDDVALIPLGGHTRGHCGVAVRVHHGWLLHAGDAYYFHGELDIARPRSTLGLSLFQRKAASDNALRRQNQARLRELVRAHGAEVRVFSAHDPFELEGFQAETWLPS